MWKAMILIRYGRDSNAKVGYGGITPASVIFVDLDLTLASWKSYRDSITSPL